MRDREPRPWTAQDDRRFLLVYGLAVTLYVVAVVTAIGIYLH